jgi:hypothetical protein
VTTDPASIQPVVDAARRAMGAWRRARAGAGAMTGLVLGLSAFVVHAAFLEVSRSGGLTPAQLPTLLIWLLACPLAALVSWARPLPVARAAHELDLRAGLQDRISTALEFAGDDSAMARLQRLDAGSVSGVDARPLFPIPWRRGAPWLLSLLLLGLVVVGAALTFDLASRPAPPVSDDTSPAEDLLAAIESERELLLDRGDKEGARILDDMARAVRSIQARREELKRRIAERKAAQPPAPAEAPPELELPPPPAAGQRDDSARGDLITADDLERLEADMEAGMQMSEAQLGELTSKLFSSTRAAKKLNEEFHHHIEHEMDAAVQSPNASQWGVGESTAGETQKKMSGVDMLNQGAQSSRLSTMGDVESQANDMITRDLSAESQAAHDSAHDQQHSFNEFLKDFVKDMQGTVAEAALGKKPGKKAREVAMNTGEGMADKRDAMEEAGFEEMDELKRSSGQAPPESAAGGEPGQGAGEPGEGPPSDNLSDLQSSEGEPGADAIAIKADSPGGQTSAGASGAGTGDPHAGGARAGHIEGLAQLSGPLDEVLGKLGEGSLPTEDRKQLFDRLARHKVQAGLASEADDVLLDYFAQAEELIEGEEQFSPLFRDFATLYFDSIRPGSGPAAEPRPAESPE